MPALIPIFFEPKYFSCPIGIQPTGLLGYPLLTLLRMLIAFAYGVPVTLALHLGRMLTVEAANGGKSRIQSHSVLLRWFLGSQEMLREQAISETGRTT